MSLGFKTGVKLRLLSSQALLALIVANEVYDEYGAECVVTSGEDSHHRFGSLHYVGHAFDLRTRNLEPEISKDVADEIRRRLRPLMDYDVVLEGDHCHIEYQPHTE